MEAQLKQAEEKAQLAQQSADCRRASSATTERGAMEAQLKKAEEKAQWPSRAQILPQRSVARWKLS